MSLTNEGLESVGTMVNLPACPAQLCLNVLLETLWCGGRMTRQETGRIQWQQAALLRRLAARRLMGEGSSLPVEIAQEMLTSIDYAVGFAIKRVADVECVAEALKQGTMTPALWKRVMPADTEGAGPESGVGLAARNRVEEETVVEALYRLGVAGLDRAVGAGKRLWRAARNNQVLTPNVCYRETLNGGIGAFYSKYDTVYGAHRTPADMDYPLAVPIGDFSGIEYIAAWLQELMTENRLVGRFDAAVVHGMMQTVEPEYAGLPLNLFEPVLLCALGCELSGSDPFGLCPDAQRLAALGCKAVNTGGATGLLREAAQRLVLRMGLGETDALCSLMLRVATENAPRLCSAAQHDALTGFFGMRAY